MIESTLLLPNYNNERVLPHTFSELRRTIDCSRVRFVAVDDGSEDRGLSVLKHEAMQCGFAEVEILARPHEGVVAAVNAGLEAISTPFVFRIDGDAIVQLPGWTTHLERHLREPEIGLVGGHTIFDSGLVHGFGRSVVGEYGLYDLGTFPTEPTGRRTLDSNVHRPVRSFPGGRPYEVDTVLATCIGFRLEDARAVGGFDMRFSPVWIEDDDFGLALRRLGRKVIVDPSLQILHKVSLRGSRKPGDGGASGPSPASNAGTNLLAMVRQRLGHALRPMPPNFSPMKMSTPGESASWRTDILRSHYRAWREKWGFDPLNPDLAEVFERHYDSEICWLYNRDRYLQGRRLIARLSCP